MEHSQNKEGEKRYQIIIIIIIIIILIIIITTTIIIIIIIIIRSERYQTTYPKKFKK